MRIMEARKNIFFAAALSLCAIATGIPSASAAIAGWDVVSRARTHCEDIEGFVVVKDVNGDGIEDYILAYGKCHSYWCGSSGCRTQVLASQPDGTFVTVLKENVLGVRFARA